MKKKKDLRTTRENDRANGIFLFKNESITKMRHIFIELLRFKKEKTHKFTENR